MLLPQLILFCSGQQVRQWPDRYVVDRLIRDRYPKPTPASTPCAPASILATVVLATVARFALAGALLFGASLNRPNPARLFGALFTYICGIVLAAGLLVT